MLKTTRSSQKSASRAFRADDNEVVEVGDRANKTVVNLSKNEKSRNSTYMSNIRATRKPNFLTPNVKKTFNYLKLAFIKALILWHFDLENHTQIKIDASGYAIGGVLNQLNFNSDVPSNNLNLNKSNFGQ